MQNSFLEQANVAEHNYMLQFLKLKVCVELVPETLHCVLTWNFIFDYLYITIIYKGIFTTGASHWTTASSLKFVSGITLSENTTGSLN